MGQCICSSCKNLKAVVDDEGGVEEYQCKFGFPSDSCEDCNEEQCEQECENYVSDEEKDEMYMVRCTRCGKELTLSSQGGNEGEIYCTECYFKSH